MTKEMLGKKIGMSQMFNDKGAVVPVTFLQVGPCVILQRKTKEKDGYDAIQVGFDECPERLVNKALKGHFKKGNAKPVRLIKEIKGSFSEELGSEIKVDIFKEGEQVNITGVSKGKGFAGGMKRWGWHGGKASHGSMTHRRIGSVGAGTSPGRVFKGKTMPGRMGHDRVTLKNLEVVKIDKDKNLLIVKGAVPGIRGGYLVICKSTAAGK